MILQVDVIGKGLLLDVLPFIESVGQHKAPFCLNRVAERGSHGDGFSFGIQGLFSYSTGSVFILYLEGDQSPAIELNFGRIIIGNDRQLGI